MDPTDARELILDIGNIDCWRIDKDYDPDEDLEPTKEMSK
jgi:hypothetical protein